MKIYQVDAFTNEIFKGNQAAVCILENDLSSELMQNIAAEMNLSETAFIKKENDKFEIRWFTPTQEEKLCGHATLASSHIIWETNLIPQNQEIIFNSKSGILKAKKSGKLIELDFPIEIEKEVEIVPESLKKAIPLEFSYVGKNRLDYLIEVDSEKELRKIEPKFKEMSKLDCRGVILTAKSQNPNYDFVSRFFAPSDGILEDPVTGSAHCCLAPYWRKILNKDKFSAFQASERSGELEVEITDDRIKLRGEAVTVFSGDLFIKN